VVFGKSFAIGLEVRLPWLCALTKHVPANEISDGVNQHEAVGFHHVEIAFLVGVQLRQRELNLGLRFVPADLAARLQISVVIREMFGLDE